MPDKTNNEPIKPAENSPSGPEPEPKAAAAALTPEPSTINPQPSTLEVHHHAHGAHGKKTWKSYFWEFLMLFLAVFCGFLAEYQLEHKIERDREREYMNSLYQDLKADTLNLGSLLVNTKEDVDIYDSLFGIFKSKKYLQETSGVYYFGRKLVTLRIFNPTDGTLTQLENSGGLRLIRSRTVVDSIQSYKLAISLLKNIQEFQREHFVLARNTMGKIFDANVFDIMMGDGSKPLERPVGNYPLMPFSVSDLNDFHIPMNFIRRNKVTQLVLIKRLQKKAADLMNLLQKKYSIEKE